MRFGGIAWDVDGTLADSEPRHHRALLAASRRWGVDLAALPEAAFRGLHNADVWQTLQPRFPATLARDTWLDAIDDAYVDDAGPIHPMPGALDAMIAEGISPEARAETVPVAAFAAAAERLSQ